MKKVLFVALSLMIVSVTANAQQGTLLVGGSIDFGSTKTPSFPSDTKTSNFQFSPTVGYQFTNNWTAGVVTSIGSSKYTNSQNIEAKQNSFAIGPFVRYAKSLSSIFAIYGQAQGIFGTLKSNGNSSSTAAINVFPAIFINVKNGFGLNFNVGELITIQLNHQVIMQVLRLTLHLAKLLALGFLKILGCTKKDKLTAIYRKRSAFAGRFLICLNVFVCSIYELFNQLVF